MEKIASYIGLPIVSLKARHAVMNYYFCKDEVVKEIKLSGKQPLKCHSKYLEILLDEETSKSMLRCLSVDEDDETASTVSSTADESFSNSISFCTVSFAEPLVTAIYTRPVTLPEDKKMLHYCDKDFRQFRREYLLRKRTCLVRFPTESVVTDVYEYPSPENSESLYYNESDLQRFLDEFVTSLNGGCS